MLAPCEIMGLHPDARIAEMRERAELLARENGWDSADAEHVYYRIEKRRRERMEFAKRIRATREHRARAYGGMVPLNVADALVEQTLPETPACRAVREWLPTGQPMLILAGGVGVGKTVAALRAVVECRRQCALHAAQRLGMSYEPWKNDPEGIDRLRLDTPLIVVDDLGTEDLDHPRNHAALFAIANERQGGHLRTIFTTNLTPDQYADRYDERFRSRIAQGLGERGFHILVGDDLRRKPLPSFAESTARAKQAWLESLAAAGLRED